MEKLRQISKENPRTMAVRIMYCNDRQLPLTSDLLVILRNNAYNLEVDANCRHSGNILQYTVYNIIIYYN